MNQPKLTISLLGGVTIALDNTAVTNFASRKADALLVYLACNPRSHPRETLATLLWPDNDQTRALANLSVILTSLRKQLDNYLIAERHTVSFNYERPVVLDVVQFEQGLAGCAQHRGGRSGSCADCMALAATAVSSILPIPMPTHQPGLASFYGRSRNNSTCTPLSTGRCGPGLSRRR